MKPNIGAAIEACKHLMEGMHALARAQASVVSSLILMARAEDNEGERSMWNAVSTGQDSIAISFSTLSSAVKTNLMENLQFLSVDVMQVAQSLIAETTKISTRSTPYSQRKATENTINEWVIYRQIRHDMQLQGILSFCHCASREVREEASFELM